MEKLIAFDLYKKNDFGGHTSRLSQSKNTAGFGVYLATEVEALLKAVKKELDDDDLSVARRMVDTALMVK